MKIFKTLLIVFSVIILLTACQSKWRVDVDLTPEEREAIMAEIEECKLGIKNFDGPEGEIPNREIIRLALAYEKLGDLGAAIKLYKSWLDQGFRTKAIINNLGRLYEKVGEYELAIEQYQRLVDEYFDTHYLYDITWAYIHAKKRKEAEKYFNAWQLEFQKTDGQTQQAIKKLREEEKNN